MENYFLCPLSAVICRHISDATVVHRHCQRWCSQGLDGWQLTITLKLADETSRGNAKSFLQNIGDFDFHLPGLLVADIIAEQADAPDCDENHFEISALIVKE